DTESPVLLIELDRGAPGVADLVHDPVVGAAALKTPVEEARARIVGIGVAVKQIRHLELAGRERDAGDVLLAGELVWAVLHSLLLAAEPEGLPYEHAPYVHARYRKARLLCFAVGEAAEAERVAETVALHQLGIDVDLGTLPWAKADEGGRTRRVLVLAAA